MDKREDKRGLTERLELWQKVYENGHYERNRELGMEVNYNVVDGCVNLQRDNSGKAFLDAEKQPKKQIAIVKRTGR